MRANVNRCEPDISEILVTARSHLPALARLARRGVATLLASNHDVISIRQADVLFDNL